jgi:FlaA1/EpsC-like NDP-sugar epimerase
MTSRNYKLYSLILIIADIFVLLLAFVFAYVLRTQFDQRPLLSQVYATQYLTSALLIVPFWSIIFAFLGLYQKSIYSRRLAEWSRIGVGSFIGILFVVGWQYASGEIILPARLVAVYAFVAAFLLIILEREFLRALRDMLYRYGVCVKRVLII